jgi:hypothetical protein
MMKKMLIVAVCAVVMTGEAKETQLFDESLPPAEGWSPVGFAFVPMRYFQFPGAGSDVDGLRIGLTVGHNRQVDGIDIGAIGSWTDGELNGLSCSGIYKYCGGATFGIHLSSTVNYASGRLNGSQFSLVNSAYGVNGLQVGLVNYVSEGNGCQLGVFNLAETLRGVQLGLVNTAMNCSGIQIGLGNIIGESPLTACVFFNAWF